MFTETYCTRDTKLAKGDTFRLIGSVAEFVVKETYLAASFIPSVHGITKNGSLQTFARIEDTIFINRAA